MKYIVICLMAFALHGSVHAMLKKNLHDTHSTGAQEKPFGADWPKVEAGELIEVDSFANVPQQQRWLLSGALVKNKTSGEIYECVSDEIVTQKNERNNALLSSTFNREVSLKSSVGVPMKYCLRIEILRKPRPLGRGRLTDIGGYISEITPRAWFAISAIAVGALYGAVKLYQWFK